MDFSSMNFANNIFNTSSLFGSVGISMVNGVEVTAINLLENNEVSVTLIHSTTAATANNVNASTMPPPLVTVMAIRAPMNLKDLMSLASESSKMTNSSTTNNPFIMGAMQDMGQ
jgi:hypothetical protein